MRACLPACLPVSWAACPPAHAVAPARAPCSPLAPIPPRSVDLARPPQRCAARILLTAEQRVPSLEPLVTTVTVPPLRVRPADILDLEKCVRGRACCCLCVCGGGGREPRVPHAMRTRIKRQCAVCGASCTQNHPSTPLPPLRWHQKDVCRARCPAVPLLPPPTTRPLPAPLPPPCPPAGGT